MVEVAHTVMGNWRCLGCGLQHECDRVLPALGPRGQPDHGLLRRPDLLGPIVWHDGTDGESAGWSRLTSSGETWETWVEEGRDSAGQGAG